MSAQDIEFQDLSSGQPTVAKDSQKIAELYKEWGEISGQDKWVFGISGLLFSTVSGYLASLVPNKSEVEEFMFELTFSTILILMGVVSLSAALYCAYREYIIPRELEKAGEEPGGIPDKLSEIRTKKEEEYQALHANLEPYHYGMI
jgi:hypothetical protein